MMTNSNIKLPSVVDIAHGNEAAAILQAHFVCHTHVYEWKLTRCYFAVCKVLLGDL